MQYLMRIDTRVESSQEAIYLHACDFDADQGRGKVILTHNPDNALSFASPEQGKIFWERSNKYGLAPLRRLTVAMVSREVARLIHQNKSKILNVR
jgi:hypothetical protein